MLSISISREGGRRGFTVIELMVGVAMAVSVALALAPVWLSWMRVGDAQIDQVVWFAQSRVAVARFERDMRQASAAGCPFRIGGALLDASPTQVVLLVRGKDDAAVPLVVEWEITKTGLMRRWRTCPQARPAVWTHSGYVDSKTMMSDVSPLSEFVYYAGGRRLDQPVAKSALDRLTHVAMDIAGPGGTLAGEVAAHTIAGVGR